jgi:DNA-directed RNA polymerase subunit RPC12/RpoP
MIQSGLPCPCGSGRIVVVKSEVKKETKSRIQYLGCRHCGYRPDNNKRVLGLHERSPEMARA